MSTTSSPARPVQSPTLVLNEEDIELQAFLAATNCEAQEKWEKLQVANTSEVAEKVVGEGGETIEAKENVEEDVIGVEKEVVPKVEPRPWKVVTRMVAGLPRNCEVILIISIPKKCRMAAVDPEVVESSWKRQKIVQSPVIVDMDSDSIPVPFPRPCECCVCSDQVCRPQPNAPNVVACERCHIARQSCSFLQKSKKMRVRSPPSESNRGEKRELHHAIKELTVQVRALVHQGQRGRESRGRREDHKGKGKRRESTPDTDHYSSE